MVWLMFRGILIGLEVDLEMEEFKQQQAENCYAESRGLASPR